MSSRTDEPSFFCRCPPDRRDSDIRKKRVRGLTLVVQAATARSRRRPGRAAPDANQAGIHGGEWMPISFNSVLIIAGISVFVPVVLGLLPRLPVPGAVLEVIAGIVVGPSVLNWVRIDAPVEVLSTLGLGMLLFLAGLELDVEGLRGPLGRLAGLGFAVSAALGLGAGF